MVDFDTCISYEHDKKNDNKCISRSRGFSFSVRMEIKWNILFLYAKV